MPALARPLAAVLLAAAALPAGAHAATATPLNWMTGQPDKGTILSCAPNGRSGSFKISGPTTKGLVGKFEAQGSATFGPPVEFGYGAVTAFSMTFHVKGPAGEVLNGKMQGGDPAYDISENSGACGNDADFGYSFSINGVKNVTWKADVKTRFGVFHDKGTGNVNNLSVYGHDGSAGGTAPNLTSEPTGKPVNVNAPAIRPHGQALSCSGGDWVGAFAVSKYEWLRDGTVVLSGYNATTYQPKAEDNGHKLVCLTTADRGFGLDAVTAASKAFTVGGCLVPKLRGLTRGGAATALQSAHCTLGTVKKRNKKGVKRGHVLSQNPVAGVSGPAGMKVNIVIRKKN
jgi:hypothetical protein